MYVRGCVGMCGCVGDVEGVGGDVTWVDTSLDPRLLPIVSKLE